MQRRGIILIGLLAVLSAGLLTAGAYAGRFSMSSSSWRETIREEKFEETFGINRIVCPVTLEGSFHSRTFAKTVGTLIGYINRATISESSCTGGRASYEAGSLPWTLSYRSFSGTLPRITEVRQQPGGRVITMSIPNGMGGFITCRYQLAVGDIFNVTWTVGANLQWTATSWSLSISVAPMQPMECPARIIESGTSAGRTLEGGNITINLI